MIPTPVMAEVSSAKDLWEQFVNEIMSMITDPLMWTSAALVLGRIILILLASRLVLMVINRIIDHFTSDRESLRLKLRTRRVQTVGKLLKNTALYTVNFIVILLILGEFRIELAPLLAGAGVLGLAVGFGAQSLVKDVITGFFIILEDQFAVGDVIETGGFKGTVEMIGLRATRIRSWTGEVYIVPNGIINAVTNFSVNQSLAVVDLTIPYNEQADELMDAIRSVLAKITDPNMTGTPELLGIQNLSLNEMTLRITAECKGNTQTAVTRVINTAMKKALESRQTQVS